MNKHTLAKLVWPLFLLASIQLAGCATNSNQDNSRDQQGPPSMGGRGGMHQGPPSGNRDNQNDKQEDREPPEEAFTACEGKQVGDNVEFTTSNGQLLQATCQDYNDHLVAMPVNKDSNRIHR
ncbi:hypothetical protein [Desulfosediminicola flagellatus]|uniref:hypothetical protein n=1 Tax=Desulfosediminicola flagellatus TaxID=2569541 RepID=UPI0010AC8CA3|nr:hypothetical protein [Desulfosediminicola flagellatus]